MVNSFSDKGSLILRSREAIRQKNEAFMSHVSSSLCFAHVPLLAQVVLSLKVSRVFVKCCLACFALMLLFIVMHVTPALAAMNAAKNVSSGTEPLIMMYGTHVHSLSLSSQVSDDMDNPPAYLSSMLSRPEPRKVGKVSFYAAMFVQNSFSLSPVAVPFGSESIMLALLAKNCLIGLTYIAAEHNPHSVKVRKKHEKLTPLIDAHEASYHVDEIIDLDDEALSYGWLVSGSSPPETRAVMKASPAMLNISTLLLIMAVMTLLAGAGYNLYVYLLHLSPLKGYIMVKNNASHRRNTSMFFYITDRLGITAQIVRPPPGRAIRSWHLIWNLEGERRRYSLHATKDVPQFALDRAVLQIIIRENERGDVLLFYKILSPANNQVRLVMNDASYDGFIRDYGEDILFGEDTISMKLDCR